MSVKLINKKEQEHDERRYDEILWSLIKMKEENERTRSLGRVTGII